MTKQRTIRLRARDDWWLRLGVDSGGLTFAIPQLAWKITYANAVTCTKVTVTVISRTQLFVIAGIDSSVAVAITGLAEHAHDTIAFTFASAFAVSKTRAPSHALHPAELCSALTIFGFPEQAGNTLAFAVIIDIP